MESLSLLREHLEKVRMDADFSAFISTLNDNNIAYYVYFVATGNITFVKKNEDFVPLKSSRYLLKINPAVSARDARIAAKRHFYGETTYEIYCGELANAGVFRWIVDLSTNVRSYYSVTNRLLHTESLL
ncbi:TPA: DUF1398 family protein [Klebsiella aerogenes]|nr:DUF1398 family protein [Klebsiella aerogenes]